MGSGLGRGKGIEGLKSAPLNFIMKRKHPRNTPWGDEPGSNLGEDFAPLNLSTMLLPVR